MPQPKYAPLKRGRRARSIKALSFESASVCLFIQPSLPSLFLLSWNSGFVFNRTLRNGASDDALQCLQSSCWEELQVDWCWLTCRLYIKVIFYSPRIELHCPFLSCRANLPSATYLRLDGSVPSTQRHDIVLRYGKQNVLLVHLQSNFPSLIIIRNEGAVTLSVLQSVAQYPNLLVAGLQSVKIFYQLTLLIIIHLCLPFCGLQA